MTSLGNEHLRNVVLLSHSGAGKTVLSEAMLYTAGIISRQGTIEDGNTVSDYEPEEQDRQSSIQTTVMSCPWKDHKINIVDTPGYADFRGEVISGVQVADGVILVVSAASGIEVGTQQMWQMAQDHNLPSMIVVTKLDRENTDFQRTLGSIVESFGRKCVATQIPIGAEDSFSGSINLLNSGSETPESLTGQVENARDSLAEAVAETDDNLIEKYLDGEALTDSELNTGLKKGMESGAIVPVLVAAPSMGIGVKDVLDAVVELMPSPFKIVRTKSVIGKSETVELSMNAEGPLAALVFKTAADQFVGKLSYLKLISGTLKSDSQVWNSTKRESERVGQLFILKGKTQEPIDQLVAGDVGAVAKLSSVLTGDTISQKEKSIVLEGFEFPSPVYQMAMYPKTKADLDKMTTAAARIVEEDPSLTIIREPNTLEMLLGGLGDTHVEVSVGKMKRKFGVEIRLETPKVPYMETISSSSKVEYRHKKQSGGHGQFAHVWLELTPLPRGEGSQFASKIVGGTVPKEYIPGVQKGVNKAMVEGVLAGHLVVDVKATLVDGSFHPVDSSGIAFEIAGGNAFSKGLKEASPILLEPVMMVAVTVPDTNTGDVIGDLNGKRARILGMTPNGSGLTFIEAHVPQAEVLRYATDLRSLTQGKGLFTMKFDRYEQVPSDLVQRIIVTKDQSSES